MFDTKAEEKILIVGAGPSGLALAVELKRRGVNAVIVDQQPAGVNTSRACVVHARTMEVLEPIGVTRDLLAEGIKVPIFRIHDRDRPLLTVDFSEIPSFYRFTLMIPQNRVEQILLQHLESLGCNVMRPCKLIRYTTSPSRVEAQIQVNGSDQSIRAQWLIGCDGMHSSVREQSGIAFSGGGIPGKFRSRRRKDGLAVEPRRNHAVLFAKGASRRRAAARRTFSYRRHCGRSTGRSLTGIHAGHT